MKRLLLVTASMLCLVVFFFACSDFQNLSEPKKVVVKPGDATYSIPFGGYSVAFDDYINVSKLQENLANASGDDVQLRVWDYQDQNAKSLQQFIVEYPITSISLNPDDYLGDITDFLQNFKLSDDGDSQISIPINDVFKQVRKSLADCERPVDVQLKTLSDAIDNATGLYSKKDNQITGVTLSVDEDISLPQVGFDYGAEGFIKQAVIEKGAFTIACELPSGWSGVTATVSLTVSGAIAKTGFKNVNKGGEYLIRQEADLAGKTIDGKQKDITIEGTITFECNNATIVLDDNGNIPKLTLVCTSKIKKIRDAQIYLEKVLSSDDAKLEYNNKDNPTPVSIPEYVKNCKIVKLDMQAAVDTNLAGVIKQLYIAPKITSDVMGIDASDNTDYSNMFADDGGLHIIKDVDKGWNGFYLVDKENNKRLDEIDLDVMFDIRGDNYNPARPNEYTETEDTITITSFDVTSDTDYYLKPTFGAPKDGDMLECDDLELQIDSDLNQEGEIETGLSIGDMLNDIVDGDDDSAQGKLINDLIDAIELQGIEGYLYVTAPTTDGNPLQNLPPIKGNVTARYDGGEKPLFEIADSEKSLIRYGVPSFASLADENRLITKDTMFTERYYSARTAEGSLCEIINNKVNNLAFDYDISFGSSGVITLDRAQIRALQEAAKDAAGGSAVARAEIAMTIAVVLPLKLNITKDIVVDNIMTLAGDNDEDIDLLGGEDSDYSEYTKYTEALKSLTVYYQCKNPFDGLSITAALSEKNLHKDMHFDNEEHPITIDRADVDKILEENSFKPKIGMTMHKTLPEKVVSVKRNTEFKMTAALVIETNNDAEIEFEL